MKSVVIVAIAFVLLIPLTSFAELYPIEIENPVPESRNMGFKIALDEDYLLVSARDEGTTIDEFGNEVREKIGRVFLYDCKNLPNCILIEELTSSSDDLDDGFGLELAFDWPYVVVGAPNTGFDVDNDGEAEDIVGIVYFYKCDPTKCSLIETIEDPTPEFYGQFGYSLALSGKNMVIGSWRDDVDTITDVGTVYLYSCTDSGCTLADTILNPTPEEGEGFGLGIDIDGKNIIIGAKQVEVNDIEDAGMAYHYDCSSTSCQLKNTLTNPTPDRGGNNGDMFGYRVSISGTTIAVGAPFADTAQPDEGEVYLYDCSQTCNLVDTLQNPTPVTSYLWNPEHFGETGVDLQGDLLLVSTSHAAVDFDGSGKIEDDEEAIGEVYLYDCSNNTCQLIETISSPELTRGAQFGTSDILSENRIAVGSHSNMAYLFTDVEHIIIQPEIIEEGNQTDEVTGIDIEDEPGPILGPVVAPPDPVPEYLLEQIECEEEICVEECNAMSNCLVTWQPDPTPELVPEPIELGMASFVDETKDPQSYVDRYNNEPIYKEWFDNNYPEYSSIYEAVGLSEPIPEWVRGVFVFWANGNISDAELKSAIAFLVDTGIIVLNDN